MDRMIQEINVKDLINSMIDKIINRRKFLKISQEKLSKGLGISRFKLIRIENRETEITLEEYIKCCIILDLVPFDI